MDPVTIALAIAGLGSSLYGGMKARQMAGTSLDFQKSNLANALSALQSDEQQRLGIAGGVRKDQFGNATYYDPATGQWTTSYTPQQQRLLTADQARQERTLSRGAQASEDYAQQRAGYLYNQPPSEEAIQNQITQLLRGAQGEGERALNTLTGRWATRTAGNIPVLRGPGNIVPGQSPGMSAAQQAEGMTPAQELARTLLQAREQAVTEEGTRQAQHASQYLPAMAAFEKTANVVPQESQLGTDVLNLTNQGQAQMLSALADYGKNVNAAYIGGGRNVGKAYSDATTAAGNYPGIKDFMSIATALKGKTPTGTAAAKTATQATPDVGSTTQMTDASGAPITGGDSASSIGLGGPQYAYPPPDTVAMNYTDPYQF